MGSISGSLGITPIAFVHDVLLQGSVAQWEFDTDVAALDAGLFAIVYRYCIRDDDNPMLNQGVVGAFVLARALARVDVPNYCTPIPLNCRSLLVYTREE